MPATDSREAKSSQRSSDKLWRETEPALPDNQRPGWQHAASPLGAEDCPEGNPFWRSAVMAMLIPAQNPPVKTSGFQKVFL